MLIKAPEFKEDSNQEFVAAGFALAVLFYVLLESFKVGIKKG